MNIFNKLSKSIKIASEAIDSLLSIDRQVFDLSTEIMMELTADLKNSEWAESVEGMQTSVQNGIKARETYKAAYNVAYKEFVKTFRKESGLSQFVEVDVVVPEDAEEDEDVSPLPN